MNQFKKLPSWPTHLLPAILGILAGLGLLVVGGLVFAKRQQPASTELQTIMATPTPPPPKTRNVLLLGYGGPQHQGGYLTDTILIASFDLEDKDITLISLPRDLWVPLPGENGVHAKINNIFALGRERAKQNPETIDQDDLLGGELAQQAIGEITGLPIDNFIAVDFRSFENTINQLGGLQVNVPHAFDDYWYPLAGEKDNPCGRSEEDIAALTATMSGYLLEQQFPCRYEHIHYDAGLQTMDGTTALKFVRSRHSETDGNDFARSNRQRALIEAAVRKLLSFKTWPKMWNVVTDLKDNFTTNLNWIEAGTLAAQYGDYNLSEINQLAITDDEDNVLIPSRSTDGQYILVPKTGRDDWSSIQTWLKEKEVKISN